MMFIVFGLLLFALWYLADKTLGKRFEGYVKWPALAIIAFFILFDINMMIETNRMIETRQFGVSGIIYNDSINNLTTYMYGVNTTDTGSVMAYHYSEFAFWPILSSLLPILFLAVGGYIVLQILLLQYDEYRGVSSKIVERGKDNGKK